MRVGESSAESPKKSRNWRTIWAVIFFVLLVLAFILTTISLLSYEGAKEDYGMVCVPVNTYPRCVSDVNQMTDSEFLSVFGFVLEGASLFLNRHVKPVFYFFTIFSVILFAIVILFGAL